MVDAPDPVTLGFKGHAYRAEESDIVDAAQMLGVGLNEFKAVLAVETAGRPFDAEGRPSMLFEPHVFYRQLSTRDHAAFSQACNQGLAYPMQGMHPYPADSYPRLTAACAIDHQAALCSASWGVGQVLGENWTLIGCASIDALVTEAMASERHQLLHMGHYILRTRLSVALRRHDWVSFAVGYNGRNQARGHYDEHLAAAFARLSGVPDPPHPAPIVVPAIGTTEKTADQLNAEWLARYQASTAS